MDLYTVSKIRSLSKKRRRAHIEKMETKFVDKNYVQQMQELNATNEKLAQKRQIDDLIQTMKALQMVGADTSTVRKKLDSLLRPN